jgi:TM2 domain-containing membrane protein YozV
MKNPGISAVLSFFFPGLGQIYNGQIGFGLLFVISFVISIGLCFVVIGIFIWIFGMIDAYSTAKKNKCKYKTTRRK